MPMPALLLAPRIQVCPAASVLQDATHRCGVRQFGVADRTDAVELKALAASSTGTRVAVLPADPLTICTPDGGGAVTKIKWIHSRAWIHIDDVKNSVARRDKAAPHQVPYTISRLRGASGAPSVTTTATG